MVMLAHFSARSQQANGTLAGFLSGQGLAGAKLERRYGNHLFVPVSINNQHAALMIDTGAPFTLIDRNSVGTFGLKVESTKQNVSGIFGKRSEHYGISVAKTIAMGNCVVTNVPVALADESDMNPEPQAPPTGSHIPASGRMAHLNGLFGSREMRKFGMIIDCARQMLYINPTGPSATLSQNLASFLEGRGFTRIPLRLNSSDHLEVPGALDGHSTHFIVDTGASTTVVDRQTALHDGIGVANTRYGENADGRFERLGAANLKELTIGNFTVFHPNVAVVNVSEQVLHSKSGEETAGLLGAEYLAFNFAVIDVGGMALYLRHPDSR
jgi:predicted aspartyl protease